MGAIGHDVVHTRDLPAGNRTTDAEICRLADLDGRAERRFFAELPAIVLALSDSAFVELTNAGLVVHGT